MAWVYFIIVMAAVAFIVWKITQTPKANGGADPRRNVPRGPDDDPDFLRRL